MPIPAPSDVHQASRTSQALGALDATRRAHRLFRLAMSGSTAVLVGLAVAVVVAGADLAWVLPTRVRALGLVALAASMVGVLARAWLATGRKSARADAAAEVEAAFPGLGQRLRTTVEYAEPGPETAPATPALVEALMLDTDRQSDNLDFTSTVPWRRSRLRGGGLAVALGVIALAVATDEPARIAAGRLFLRPMHYSKLTVEPGDLRLKEGAEFRLKATVAGRPVNSARWLRRPSGTQGAWSAVGLGAGDRPGPVVGKLESSLKNCRADFEYRVEAGELASEVYRVTVTHPLTVKAFAAAIEPPAYTRLKPSVASQGSFRVPEGSRVRLRITLDRAPASARVAWTPVGSGESRVIPLAVDGASLSGELPLLTVDLKYEVIAVASDGERLEPARHLIRVQPDEKPTVQFLKPADSLAALPTTEIPVKIKAGDDHGLTRVGIAYRIGEGAEESLYLDRPGDQPPSVEALATLYLENHPLTFADTLGYRAFVEDNREPVHQRSITEVRYVDILPYKQDYEVIEGGGSCNGSSVTLEELILRQRRTINRTLAHQDDRTVDAQVASRLSKEEAELASIARKFAEALATQFGPIGPLADASKSLEAATKTLAARDLVGALPQEQAALTALTAARQNLRKLLKTGASASACRKIDRQQQDQVLRKPPAEKSKEAELANLERDIRKLAEAEKAFAEEIEPKATGGARLDRQDPARPGPPAPPKPGGSKPLPGEGPRIAAREAGRLQELARQDPSLTELARQRMDRAAERVRQAEAASNSKSNHNTEAAEAARLAAEQLEQLAGQVAGLKAKDLADQLARARDLARETARLERELVANFSSTEKLQSGGEQRKLEGEAKTLNDLMAKAQAGAVEESGTVASAIDRAIAAHSPGLIEQAMREAAESIASGESSKATQQMGEAAQHLENLALDLDEARREFMQPRLQQLLAAEKQAAEVTRALETATSEAQKAEAEKALGDLAGNVKALPSDNGPIREAAEALARASGGGDGSSWGPPRRSGLVPGLFVPPIGHTNAVRGASKALQARIHELIRADAVVDRDGAVPPGYRDKVDDYFRLLSEDLR